MIMYSFGCYLTQTVHDHEPCPECLNLRFGHNGYSGSISGVGQQPGGRHGPFGTEGSGNRRARVLGWWGRSGRDGGGLG
jgi:hypothetical protein